MSYPIPVVPYPYSTIEFLALSHEHSLAPTMVHPVYLMPTVLMNPLLVRALFHLFAHVVPPAIHVAAGLPSPTCATLIPSDIAPSAHATPSLLSLFFSSPSDLV